MAARWWCPAAKAAVARCTCTRACGTKRGASRGAISMRWWTAATTRSSDLNGCEVVVPGGQGCCGALHVHAGLRDEARGLARRNIDALVDGGYDAILTNAAGCGSTLKEYGELLEGDPEYAARAREFSRRMQDVTEFLASIELHRGMQPLPVTVTYQDSCHLAHGQRIRTAPRKLLEAVPGLTFREMPLSDLCCGSAGIYNVVRNEMSMQILETKMEKVNRTGAGRSEEHTT